MSPNFHRLIHDGNLAAIRAALERSPNEVNAFNLRGRTPLMVAVQSPDTPIEVVEFLIEMGARLDDISRAHFESGNVLSRAIRAGDPRKVALLIQKGADVHYTHSGGYDALLDAAYGANFQERPQLIDLMKMLISNGAALQTESSYGETAIGTFSRFGRFDAVQVLVEAGVDPGRLRWNALQRAVAFGTLDEVQKLVTQGASIEERDQRERTPFLLAVQAGDLNKAEFLLQRGASSRARGHCDTPALFYAIESHRAAMTDWLLRIGADMEQTDQFGETPLTTAAEHDNLHAVLALLTAGANLETQKNSQTALALANSRDIILQLLDAGADPRQLSQNGQRILIGLDEVSQEPLLSISKDEFLADRSPRFGAANPEKMNAPFWEAMLRAGVNTYQGAQIFSPDNQPCITQGPPTWCADRFGQSLTRLPDGRIIRIGGEHEDYSDPDFCIYNDVFVHHPDGTMEIFGYPQDVFPPTDFHSATLIGDYIYVIGSLGYSEARQFGETQVLRLHTETLRFERLNPAGVRPGWISGHRATHISSNEIRVTGGNISDHDGSNETLLPNSREFILDISNLVWRQE